MRINILFAHLDLSDYAKTISPEAQERYTVKLLNNFDQKALPYQYMLGCRWKNNPTLRSNIDYFDVCQII